MLRRANDIELLQEEMKDLRTRVCKLEHLTQGILLDHKSPVAIFGPPLPSISIREAIYKIIDYLNIEFKESPKTIKVVEVQKKTD